MNMNEYKFSHMAYVTWNIKLIITSCMIQIHVKKISSNRSKWDFMTPLKNTNIRKLDSRPTQQNISTFCNIVWTNAFNHVYQFLYDVSNMLLSLHQFTDTSVSMSHFRKHLSLVLTETHEKNIQIIQVKEAKET